MKKYGILGGTFNPVHLAHLYIANEAKEQLGLDKVIFMPAGNPPHKSKKNILDAEIRYQMVEKAIKGYSYFEVSDYEILKGGLSYTYMTLQELKKEDEEIYFISGADSLMDIGKWREPEIILENCKFVVFNRGNYTIDEIIEQKNKIEATYGGEIILLNVINFDISSSIIRSRIGEGKRVDFFLPEPVTQYINEEGLYRGH